MASMWLRKVDKYISVRFSIFAMAGGAATPEKVKVMSAEDELQAEDLLCQVRGTQWPKLCAK